MPRLPINYQNTIIYKIVCNDLEIKDLYVGHTTNFTERKRTHKKSCNNKNSKQYNFKVYQIIRANGDWNNWSMIEIEKYPCNDFNEASARERYWYEELQAKLNTCVPNRSKKEYRKENKNKIAVQTKLYYNENKEQFKEYKIENKEQIKEYQREYQIQYRKEKKDKIKEYIKHYIEKNKDKINEKAKQKRQLDKN
jgi:hypothetical protein